MLKMTVIRCRIIKCLVIKCLVVKCLAAAAAVTLVACSSDDDNAANTQLNPDLESPANTGEPGGDTTEISGIWDGTVTNGATSDTIYWNISRDGVLTRYDYQQDGVEGATGENCYLVGDPITVTPERDTDYSIANVAVTAVRSGDTLTINFLEADSEDFDGNGDTTETPTFIWTIVTTAMLPDLISCN